MNATEIRSKFLDFFVSKGHKIVPSAPIVNQNDPTLMFTNAGMNQFKDYFLGNQYADNQRVVDTQKCLRVSGKHNDLEEVGRDSYHHTMFEMLGNWSFGDASRPEGGYFKKEAIDWAWELLTNIYGIDAGRLYATVFGGDDQDGLQRDHESAELWQKYLPEERILYFDKKDNFWEMGDTGPCGPCSEIHIDLRSDEERARKDGKVLVNLGTPAVIEIWNLVFIQYNRKQNGLLDELPSKHVDTGMGFERLCLVLQGKTSSYDTDIFTPFIQFIEKETGIKYNSEYTDQAKSDIAMRVQVDHLRAVAFCIADGCLPSNTGAGYVVRRILRRAVRYYYSFLNRHEPFLFTMLPLLAKSFVDVFPELNQQLDFVSNVVLEEEKSFLHTLEAGLKRIDQLQVKNNLVDGEAVFELYDTYGFPIDLSRLIAADKGWEIDEKGFEKALEAQKNRSKSDAKKEVGDWKIVNTSDDFEGFVGYDQYEVTDARILRYRKIETKGKTQIQVVLDKTPFYPEGGGQVGDIGLLILPQEKIKVVDTFKENDLIIHQVNNLPQALEEELTAIINIDRRKKIENNHSATHLLHAALRQVLGHHVTQKGSLVGPDYLRFDFAHYQKMSHEEINQVEKIVNARIRANIPRKEDRNVKIEEAKTAGAMMLFGEKYGEEVRMITFDPDYSIELCGGCHVPATGRIGYFKIVQETAVGAGVRRIEATTAEASETYINDHLEELNQIKQLLKNPADIVKQVEQLQEENKKMQKLLDQAIAEKASLTKQTLLEQIKEHNGYKYLIAEVDINDSKALKNLSYQIEKEVKDIAIVFAMREAKKVVLMVTISNDLVEKYDLHAGNMVKELAKSIQGGGGGQPFFATAGGKKVEGIKEALAKAQKLIVQNN